MLPWTHLTQRASLSLVASVSLVSPVAQPPLKADVFRPVSAGLTSHAVSSNCCLFSAFAVLIQTLARLCMQQLGLRAAPFMAGFAPAAVRHIRNKPTETIQGREVSVPNVLNSLCASVSPVSSPLQTCLNAVFGAACKALPACRSVNLVLPFCVPFALPPPADA